MATTVPYTFGGALQSLADSTQLAVPVLPAADAILPPENGISLLDVKNEIFLSYLQTLALRNLAVIRSVRQFLPADQRTSHDESEVADLQDKVADVLVRKRVYLEKGVRPLEDRLKYTIDKTLRSAVEEDGKQALLKTGAVTNGKEGSASDDDSDATSSSDEEDEGISGTRANMDNFAGSTPASRPRDGRGEREGSTADKTGAYRPPRVTATSMPEDFDRARKTRREQPGRSRTMDEYVSTEMSEAPMAQPSVGSMIAQGGRRQISARERAVQAERTEYEETHLTRLMEKKDKGAKKRRDGGFGGEDWRGLGDGLDRIDSLTRGTKKRDREGALEKSRKRRATEDGQRGDGIQPGGLFDKRKKRTMKKLR